MKLGINPKVLTVIVVVGIVSASTTYVIADYLNRGKVEDVKVKYEHILLKVSDEAKKFADNLSLALTCLDTARDDLQKALYYTSLSNFSLLNSRYREAKQRGEAAFYYFNLSYAEFESSLEHILEIGQYPHGKDLISIYVNYTESAIMLSKLGKYLCENLSKAAEYYIQGLSDEGNKTLSIYTNLKKTFNDQMNQLDVCILQIKNYHGIRK